MSVNYLALAIRDTYPDLQPGVDWYFQDDGEGPYLAKWPDGLPLPTDQVDAAMAKHARELFKQQRAEAVSRIVVTTASGRTFDGDERSQGRMARAILGLQAAPAGTLVTWVLADNVVVEVGIEELTEALQLAGLEQTRLWVNAP